MKQQIITILTENDSWLGVCVSFCSLVGKAGVGCGWTMEVWADAIWGDCTLDCITPVIGWLGTTW